MMNWLIIGAIFALIYVVLFFSYAVGIEWT